MSDPTKNPADEDAPELVLGEEQPAEEPTNEDALGEFEGYESLDEEYPEDDEENGEAPLLPESRDDGSLTPKERRLQDMTLEARIESIVFAAREPLKAAEVLAVLNDLTLTEEDVKATLDRLVEFYEERAGGFKLLYLKRLGYQFQTSDAAAAIMERMFASRPRPISRAALETLAIIAYRQPVTRAEVEFIRGVDAGSIFKTLLERELIRCTGRKEVVGRPMLFGTTDQFLTVFNLSSVKDLPPLEAFQPSRDVMQGAMARIGDGEGGELIDVEEYIADNTRRAEEEAEVTGSLQGAVSEDPADEGGVNEVFEDERDANPEVPVPDGPSLPEGGGDLDQ